MKLKNVLVLAFIVLTFIPIVLISLLLYESGFSLSKESYTRNLAESINVQSDYISQTIENDMISDYRFSNKNYSRISMRDNSLDENNNSLIKAFQTYLETSEDKIAVCMLVDKNGTPIYTIGEKSMIDNISTQLPDLSTLSSQKIQEFDLGQETYTLGIVTPIFDINENYVGSLISVYDKSYLYKVISSYYKITDTTTYISRESGEVVKPRGQTDIENNDFLEKALKDLALEKEGNIDKKVGNITATGYYKNIPGTPWYLAGFISHDLIIAFTNQFLAIYILIVLLVLIVDVVLAFYFSKRVVDPINNLIMVMDDYQNNLNHNELYSHKNDGYFETKYLHAKFFSLMKNILLVQHNFEGVYQLYQSSDMGDINIEIDVKNQTISSNKANFENFMSDLTLPPEACVVERFTKCFCEKDQVLLMTMFEKMRDEHLSVTSEAEIYTPFFDEKWYHSLVVPMYEDDRLSNLFVQLRNISSFKKQEFESFEMARRDALTQLYNRTGFTEYADKILANSRPDEVHCLMFVDMNYFKMVNDNFGHSAGDDLLRSIGQVLTDNIGANDCACRFGGDEFAVFLANTSIDAVNSIKNNIHNLLTYKFDTEDGSFTVSASIGTTVWENNPNDTLDNMFKRADANMYKAKREFKQSR